MEMHRLRSKNDRSASETKKSNNMKTQLQPSTTGIYHPKSRLQWYAVAFVNTDGEPYLVASPSIRGVKALAKYHTTARDYTIERINITKGSKA
jgi:hypothetical protein